MADVKGGVYQLGSMPLRDLSVSVFGDAAIATKIGEMKGKYTGPTSPVCRAAPTSS